MLVNIKINSTCKFLILLNRHLSVHKSGVCYEDRERAGVSLDSVSAYYIHHIMANPEAKSFVTNGICIKYAIVAPRFSSNIIRHYLPIQFKPPPRYTNVMIAIWTQRWPTKVRWNVFQGIVTCVWYIWVEHILPNTLMFRICPTSIRYPPTRTFKVGSVALKRKSHTTAPGLIKWS